MLGRVFYCPQAQKNATEKYINYPGQCKKDIISEKNTNVNNDKTKFIVIHNDSFLQVYSLIQNSIFIQLKSDIDSNLTFYILDCKLTI